MDELEEHERQVAFEKKYVLRKDYERDIQLAKHEGIVQATIFCVFILPIIFICMFALLRTIAWIAPGDFGIQ